MIKHRLQKYYRKSGGIVVYVRRNILPFVEIISNDSECVLWVSLKKDENLV